STFLEHFALAPDLGNQEGGEQQHRESEDDGVDRSLEKHEEVARGDQHGPPEIFLQHRSEHEAEHEGGRLHTDLDEEIAEQAETQHQPEVEQAVADAVDADGAEHDDRRKQHVVGHTQQRYPDADQRQVDDDQHKIADPHRRDHAPEQLRLLGHHLRAGLDALDHQRADHQGHQW